MGWGKEIVALRLSLRLKRGPVSQYSHTAVPDSTHHPPTNRPREVCVFTCTASFKLKLLQVKVTKLMYIYLNAAVLLQGYSCIVGTMIYPSIPILHCSVGQSCSTSLQPLNQLQEQHFKFTQS